jgi:hypothetical protein
VTIQFFAVEVDAFKPGSETVTIDEGHGVRPHGTLAMFPDPVPDSGTIRASDLGYRTLASDTVGLQVYPPFLSEAFNINRRMNLDPVQPSVAAAWGSIQLVNQDGQYDAISASWNSDGRDVRVLTGSKVWDTVRRVYVDPPYAALSQAFVGVATPWFLSDTTLSIPLRDATYWIERPIQPTQYLGTGGLEGPTIVNGGTLTGAPKPKARGGTAASPIRNVSPVLVDTVNRIYQYNDAQARSSISMRAAHSPSRAPPIPRTYTLARPRRVNIVPTTVTVCSSLVLCLWRRSRPTLSETLQWPALKASRRTLRAIC